MNHYLRVTRPGISAVTDLGRTNGGRYGQMTGGALDQQSAKTANVLVGMPENSPLIEVVALDFSVVTTTNLLVAVTGAPAEVSVSGVPLPQWEPFLWPAGSELTVKNMRHGIRVYIAVHGELDARVLLGSCAPDSVLGFSGPLTKDKQIGVRTSSLLLDHPYFGIPVFRAGFTPPAYSDKWEIPVSDGPDIDQFGHTARHLFTGTFEITPTSNHVGLRARALPGSPLPRRTSTQEVLSRGVPIGAVEVPAGDELLVLHRGRGVTAGYPVLAVATSIGLDRLGQARSGHTVTFTHVSVSAAVAAARAQEWALGELRQRLSVVFESAGLRSNWPVDATAGPSRFPTT